MLEVDIPLAEQHADGLDSLVCVVFILMAEVKIKFTCQAALIEHTSER